MFYATRIIATALLIFAIALGWPMLYSAAMGYIWVAVPVLLAAWAGAWFGDEVSDLFQVGPDGLIRGIGIGMLLVMSVIVAAARWQWFR